MVGLRQLALLAMTMALVLFAPIAHAFCGFYVNTGGEPMFNEATRVVLMRSGTLTVLSMQNNYKGPLESFALVVPVPVVLQRENVRTLPQGLFDRVDKLTAPRLVEYWEQDPCAGWEKVEENADNKEGGTGARAKGEEGKMGARPLVKVEAEFSVDEYDIVILSALDATALDRWLRDHKYVIPEGAEPLFRPYVFGGSKFFVAKVDPNKVRLRWGRAFLSPLRFHYDTPDFSLPIRLGLINSTGVQDLLVYILAADRYEAANYENLTIPTNLGLKDEVRNQFGAFYAALFDRTMVGHSRAVVTEYAWSPSNCDPCPEGSGPLAPTDVTLLGGDLPAKLPSSLTLTRLHARYSKHSVGEDLVFRVAPPIEGGRESGGQGDKLATSPRPASANNFQARYIIHHRWSGPVTCADPVYGIWGGPNGGGAARASQGGALVRRDLPIDALIIGPARSQGAAEPVRASHAFAGVRRWLEGLLDSRDGRTTLTLLGLALGAGFAGYFGRPRFVSVTKNMGLYVLLLAALFIVAWIPVFRSWHGYRHYRFYAEGEPLRAFLASIPFCTIFLWRKQRAEKWSARRETLLLFAALLPLAGGIVSTWRTAREGEPLFEDPSIQFSQLGRIVAEMSSEALVPIIIGCAVSTVLLLSTSWLVGRVKAPSDTPPPRSLAWQTVLAVALAGVAHYALTHRFAPLDGLLFGAVAMSLAIVARTVSPAGTRRAIAAAAIAFSAVVMMGFAARASVEAVGLGTLGGESIDPSQKRRILLEMMAHERSALLLALADAGLLIVVMVRAHGRSLKQVPKLVAEPWVAASTIALLAALVGSVTPLWWTGMTERTRGLGASMAYLSGESSASAWFSPAWVPTLPAEIAGPAVIVNASSALFATPGAGIAPEPYRPALLDKMAAAEGSESPLLVAREGLALAGLMSGLSPLIGGRQYLYRLLRGDLLDPSLARYAPLAMSPDSNEVELVPDLAVSLSPAPAGALRALGLIADDGSFRAVPLGIANGRYWLGTFDAPLARDESLVSSIEKMDGVQKVVVGFAPDAKIDLVGLTLEALHQGSYGRWRPRPGWQINPIVVTTARDALEKAARALAP